MTEAVFLCNKQWKITRIRNANPALKLQEGVFLTELILEKKELEQTEERYFLELTFFKQKVKIPAIIQTYQEGNLVVLANINSNREFLEFERQYADYREWAKDHLVGIFHNEYYLIQKINNQLVDAKRQLMRTNRKLEQALEENNEINRKLDEARIFAEQASTSKTNFLASMSHDIRTPLNAIVGFTELMQRHLMQPELLEEYVKKLRASSHYLLDLINDILDLSKIESGSLELKVEPMDIGAQIEQIITIIRPQMVQKDLEFLVDGRNEKYGYLFGDPVRFRQILMNVFSNAIKYTPAGGKIHFMIRQTEEELQKRNYQFVIEDTGIGMSQEFLKHIFAPFSRAEASVREIQGTGLGMTITKSIIDTWGGSIHVASSSGKGSCFEINLPFVVCTEEEIPEKAEVKKKDEPVILDGKSFLCAEDNDLNAEILKEMLEMEGAVCKICKDGKQLTEVFETALPGQYDAILMDVQMPVMDGYEATKRIRNSRNSLGKQIPIIAMTANAFTEDIQNCLKAGMDAHLAKPLDFDKLKELLTEICRK